MRRRLGLILLATVVLARGGVAAVAGSPWPTPITYRGDMALERGGPTAPHDGAPIVVLVHGCCGDHRDLSTLARALARRGAVVLNTDVHALGAGGGWPATYGDAICAIGVAGAERRRVGGHHPIVLVGWSDGALVATTIALGWRARGAIAPDCASGDAAPDMVIGLAGHYGWLGDPPAAMVNDRTVAWFGGRPSDAPVAWTHGNPGWWVDRVVPADVPPIALVAPDDDTAVRPFWQALVERGMEARLYLVAGATHQGLGQPRSVDGSEALAVIVGLLQLPTPP